MPSIMVPCHILVTNGSNNKVRTQGREGGRGSKEKRASIVLVTPLFC